jgi:serine/threonine protein kinase
MTLALGAKLGPYEILAPIGAGGMGEVYKARDTRLDRIVAIKISQEKFSERFEREARAVAALNHPHICTLYDVGPDYLVMEYIDGAPLKGPLPVDEGLQLAAQIAGALDAAHRKGIVHRDLKPANILLTKSGVKLLDFGLAKSPRPRDTPAATDATLTQAITREGAIVGTLPYMAPEQVQGKDADPRSDIFSFGCVLYEMFVGRRAFAATDSASTIAAILKDDPPPMTELAPLTPRPLDRLVRKCLAKDPDARWQTARDLQDELLWIASRPGETSPEATRPTPFSKRERIGWIVALLVLTSLLAAVLWRAELWKYASWRPDVAPQSAGIMRLPLSFSDGGGPLLFILSPDGKHLMYRSQGHQVGVYDLASGSHQEIPAFQFAGRGYQPYQWTPDSSAIGAIEGDQIRRVDLATGLVTAMQIGPSGSFAWNNDGGVLFSKPGAGVFRVPPGGGEPKAVTENLIGDPGNLGIVPLPGSQHFLFYVARARTGSGEIRLGSFDGKPSTALTIADSIAQYAWPGHLLYLRGDTLVAQPFDAARGVITGPAQPLVGRVARFRISQAWPMFSASQTGLLVYQAGEQTLSRLTWFDRAGTASGTAGDIADYSNPALSPDGSRLAVCIRDPATGTRDIWIYDLVRGGRTRFTLDAADHLNPVWSPDGGRIAFTSDRKGARDLYVKAVAGVAPEEPLLTSEVNKNAEDWSPDGTLLSFNYQTGSGYNLGLVAVSDPAHKMTAFHQPLIREGESNFSPDGKFLAYTAFGEAGPGTEVFVQTVEPGGGRWRISTNGGMEPHWRRDGKELFFLSGDAMMAVDIHVDGKSLNAGIPHPLFKHSTAQVGRNRYVVSSDGQRFLMIVPETRQTQPPPTLVVNWPALLKGK